MIGQRTDDSVTKLHLSRGIQCLASVKGIGKVDPDFFFQLSGVFVNGYRSFHRRIIGQLIRRCLDILIQCHKRDNIDGKDKN